MKVPAGVPQGTRLGPLPFLLMINDLSIPNTMPSLWKFADDSTISNTIPWSNLHSRSLQENIDHVVDWSIINKFELNPTKCKELTICFKKQKPVFDPINIAGQQLENVSSIKALGLTIRDDLKWIDHVENITIKAAKHLCLLRQLKHSGINPKYLAGFYCSCISSILEYACQVFHSGLTQYLSDEIERIQKRAILIFYPELSYKNALIAANLPTLVSRREMLCRKLFSSIVNDLQHKLADILPPIANSYTSKLRNPRHFITPNLRTNRARNSFIYIL